MACTHGLEAQSSISEQEIVVFLGRYTPLITLTGVEKIGEHASTARRRALLAGNVKQLQEIRLNEDLLLKILRKP